LRRTRVGDIRVEACHDYDQFGAWLDQQEMTKAE